MTLIQHNIDETRRLFYLEYAFGDFGHCVCVDTAQELLCDLYSLDKQEQQFVATDEFDDGCLYLDWEVYATVIFWPIESLGSRSELFLVEFLLK